MTQNVKILSNPLHAKHVLKNNSQLPRSALAIAALAKSKEHNNNLSSGRNVQGTVDQSSFHLLNLKTTLSVVMGGDVAIE